MCCCSSIRCNQSHRYRQLVYHHCGCSQHPVRAPSRFRQQLQVDERRLDRRVPHPAAQVVDVDVVHPQVTSEALPQHVRADLPSGHDGSLPLGMQCDPLHPASLGRLVNLETGDYLHNVNRANQSRDGEIGSECLSTGQGSTYATPPPYAARGWVFSNH